MKFKLISIFIYHKYVNNVPIQEIKLIISVLIHNTLLFKHLYVRFNLQMN